MNLIRLIKNIPLRLNEERSDQLSHQMPDAWRRIYLEDDEFIICPNDALVIAIWRFHAFSRGGRAELKDFLKLASGCVSLLDVGASAGIFSALFANTRKKSTIISVEPDEPSYNLLRETITRNCTSDSDWRSVRAVMTDRPGKLRFRSTGFGGNISASDNDIEVDTHTLESLESATQFTPDIIKLDVESYEYEILTASLQWLSKIRPRLFFGTPLEDLV